VKANIRESSRCLSCGVIQFREATMLIPSKIYIPSEERWWKHFSEKSINISKMIKSNTFENIHTFGRTLVETFQREEYKCIEDDKIKYL